MSTDVLHGVSFRDTPLAEVSEIAAKIAALGWVEEDRGADWMVKVCKRYEDAVPSDWQDELREAFGEHWVEGV